MTPLHKLSAGHELPGQVPSPEPNWVVVAHPSHVPSGGGNTQAVFALLQAPLGQAAHSVAVIGPGGVHSPAMQVAGDRQSLLPAHFEMHVNTLFASTV